jgi:hypothetical protein
MKVLWDTDRRGIKSGAGETLKMEEGGRKGERKEEEDRREKEEV